jgi:hypothetical protein
MNLINNNINWIHNLIYKEGNLKINLSDLKIPGSYDSGNYKTKKNTKHLNFFLQLCNGLRFFDINISYEETEEKGMFFICDKEGKKTISIFELFKNIGKFMIKYKDPIIIKINYKNTSVNQQQQFEQIISMHFNNFLVTTKDIFNINVSQIPLAQLLSKNKKLFIFTEQATFLNSVYCNITKNIDDIKLDIINYGSTIKRLQCYYSKNNHKRIYNILNDDFASKISVFLLKVTTSSESINSVNQIILSNY